MTVEYELYLTDDHGRRKKLIRDTFFLSYTRAVSALGTCSLGLAFKPFIADFNPYFQPDWRLEIWRSPKYGTPLRREDVFMLRKFEVYTRREDSVQIIQFYGRNGIDLLNRRHIIQRATTQWTTKTDYADDMMKEIVREQMLYGSSVDEDGTQDNTRAWPNGEFSVESDKSAGPTITKSFEGKRVFDVLKDIKATSFQKYQDDPDNVKRIFFNVDPVPLSLSGNASPLGWKFVTRSGLYGIDRTNGLEFSLENENIESPTYSLSHLDEVNSVYVQGGGRGETQIIEPVTDSARVISSSWNRVEKVTSASNETDTTGLQDAGTAELEKNKPAENLPVVFLNTPGNADTPRSLYGLDWDLGDRLPINYAGKQFEAEVNIIYVSVHDDGREEVTGRNEIQNV